MTDSSESQDTTARLMEEIAALKSKVASAEADAARSSREKLDFKARNDALQQQLDTYAATKEATEGVGFEEAEEEAKKSVETLADGDVSKYDNYKLYSNVFIVSFCIEIFYRYDVPC